LISVEAFLLARTAALSHPSRGVFFLIVAPLSEAVDASDLILADCDAALNDQQLALGDFIYAQGAEQDFRGREE
tara:strand:- start:81 stop:302 length:222 start_codon:yes stop_codon:yes gene_type:complete